MFDDLFNKCPHEYKQVGFIPYVTLGEDGPCNVPCYFLECKNCGKRKVLRESDYAYTDAFLDMIDLWIKHQLKIDFKNAENIGYGRYEELNTNNKWDSKFVKALEQVLGEVERLDLPMHDSSNRLVVNNIKGIVNNALTEDVDNE